jgi:hypothetical protein
MVGARYLISMIAGVRYLAPGEPVECFSPNAAVMRAEALSRREGQAGAMRSVARAIPRPEISATHRSSGGSVTCQMICLTYR